MIFADEARLTTIAAVPVGNLIAYYGYGAAGQVALVLEHPEGGKQLFVLPDAKRVMALQDTEVVLDLGVPRIAFDLKSSLNSEEIAKPGTLLLLQTGPAVYWAHPNFSSQGMSLPVSGGETVFGGRSSETPGFNRWQVGIMRDQDFVPLASIDL